MPSAPTYLARLPDAIETLRQLPDDVIDRRTLEVLLSVSKATAWRLLKSCGGHEGPGGALVCRRVDLIDRLEELARGERYQVENFRRQRLEALLENSLRDTRQRRTTIARDTDAIRLMSTELKSLPPGVSLTRTRLVVEFTGMEDFLAKVGAVIFALNNDPEQIANLLN